MNSARISQVHLLFLAVLLAFGPIVSDVKAESSTQLFTRNTADFGSPFIGVVQGSEAGISKTKFLDKGLFYVLNTGDKKSFLSEENAYFIIYKHGTSPAIPEEELKNRFSQDFDIISGHRLRKHVKFKIRQGRNEKAIISALYRSDPSIHFISPSLTTKDKGGELAVVPNIVVRIDENVEPGYAMAELSSYGLSFLSKLPSTDFVFEMKVDGPVDDISRIFELTRTVAELPFIRWAEPDFITGIETHFTPNDPLFNNQWHLHNTGQNGAAVDADVDAPEGWDFAKGIGAVIAIYDGGIDLAHEDLNIWSNPGETGGGKETNGIDDDSNGYIDDYQGWDFTDNDNDPSPVDGHGPNGFQDNHGTSVAGVAGAIGNNGIGVSGSAQGAEIIPVRMDSGSCSDFANAMRYAGKHADVVSDSWTISACESNLNSAISDVVNGSIPGARRGTKGTPVLFASGNDASGWRKFTLTGFPAGTFSFRWRYSKDINTSSGYDTVWVDDIKWPGGGTTDFESDTVGNIPSGFTSGGNAVWTVVSDGIHARGATGKSAKAGTITDSQETYLDITRSVGAGDLTFWAWVSSEQDFDFFDFYVNGTLYFHYTNGQYGHNNDVGYPASNPDTIAVGASNDGGISGEEERSYYSEFGSALDIVAPSSGGAQGITTTDRMGAKGYTTANYTSTFGGTSSATPLVAGIVADIIAASPSLTSPQVRSIIHNGADKIGPYAYPGGRNDFYGYGRVNLYNSLCTDGDSDGYSTCANDCDDGNPAINPAASEVCDNVDNNCDGTVDEGLTRPTTCGEGECSGNTGEETCTAGVWGNDTCDPFAGATAEVCDNLDNNCDGNIDEGLQFQLTSSVVPSGNGSVIPDCSAGCTYDCLDSAVLNAIEDNGYPFSTWTGCTSSSNNICTVTMDDNMVATAEFDPCRYPARVLGTATTSYYPLLQDALNSASANDTVEARLYSFTETISYNNAAEIIFKAGYDCIYSTVTGATTVIGNIAINNGSITIESGTVEVK